MKDVLASWQAKVTLFSFLIFSLIWFLVNFNLTDGFLGEFFANTYGIIALWGAIWGLLISGKFGGLKSVFGKALIFFSLGLFAQEFGQIAYSYYYYYLHIDAPYPSLGDLGYFGSIPLYIIALWFLAKASGVSIALSSVTKKLQAVILPLVLLTVAYLLFLQNYSFDWSNPLIIFLDFGYPLGQAIYIAIALLIYLLSRSVLGGIMRSKVLLILFALFLQFLADYTFLYQTSNGTWVAGGVNDLLYLLSYTVMAIALIQFMSVWTKLKRTDS